MGQLETKPYDVADGKEYTSYLQHICGEASRLRREGRLPDNEPMLEFFDDVDNVLEQILRDVARADGLGQGQVVTRIDMSAAHYRRLMSMSESLGNLFEILQIRQALDMKRTDGAARVAQAVREGTFTDQA